MGCDKELRTGLRKFRRYDALGEKMTEVARPEMALHVDQLALTLGRSANLDRRRSSFRPNGLLVEKNEFGVLVCDGGVVAALMLERL